MVRLLMAAVWGFSVPEAPYSIDRDVKDGVPGEVCVSRSEITVGSRKVKLTGSILGVFADGTQLLDIRARFRCNKEWNFIEDFDVTVDRDGCGVHRVFTWPGSRTKDGKDFRFESNVRVMPNGEVCL